MRTCCYTFLGRFDYDRAHLVQERMVAERKANERPDHLLLIEHPHVITLGRGARRQHVLVSDEERRRRGVELYETGRGGDVTYHGPGQLVGYPIMSLAPDRCDVRRYVRDLEEVLIRTAADYGVTAGRIAGLTGVWVGRAKLAAIGVRISRWVTMHGFAFNVSTDLSYFDLIIPCGIADHDVTSLARLCGRQIELGEVAAHLVRHFGEVFDRRMIETAATGLAYDPQLILSKGELGKGEHGTSG